MTAPRSSARSYGALTSSRAIKVSEHERCGPQRESRRLRRTRRHTREQIELFQQFALYSNSGIGRATTCPERLSSMRWAQEARASKFAGPPIPNLLERRKHELIRQGHAWRAPEGGLRARRDLLPALDARSGWDGNSLRNEVLPSTRSRTVRP